MIISRTPYRVSFFGGGTDYPAWYKDNGGSILGSSIAYYCYIYGRALPPFFDHKYLISWSRIEKVNEINDIEHPVVRESIRCMNIEHGMEVQHHGDLPARSGLGSSSSFTASMLNMLHTLKGNVVTKDTLAKESIYLEQTILKENVGIQDQILTSYGGFNKISILPDGNFSVSPIPLSIKVKEQLESNVLMFYTGVSRLSSNISADVIKSVPKNKTDLLEMQKLVDVAIDLVTNGNNIDDFGYLLHETWKLKRSLASSISPDFVDEIYNKAILAGALGGKLLGAGGGGFIIFYVTSDMKEQVLQALKDLIVVPFKIEYDGARIMFYESQKYSKTAIDGSISFLR
jgi:D-glycero-alpha-D-manno-heptose-7-phosphate kinase